MSQSKARTISSHHTEDIVIDVMADRPFHRIMLFLARPGGWPNWKIVLVLFAAATVSGLAWWLLTEQFTAALFVTGLMLLSFLADAVVLFALPQLKISFGPWRSQLIVLAIPRTLAALAIGFMGPFAGWERTAIFAVVTQIAGTAAFIWGAAVEPADVHLTAVDVSDRHLTQGSRPIRLLHITDLHIERLGRRENKILEALRELEPDLIVITGDYVNLSYNRDPQTYEQIGDFLSKLSAPLGVYATLGTPTVDRRDHLLPLFDKLPIKLMRNSFEIITVEDGNQLVLLGLDCTHQMAQDGAKLKDIVSDCPVNLPKLLLYHSPELMPQAAEAGVELYLCGHTHGGQVRLPLLGPIITSSQLGRRYVMGSYVCMQTHLYVSRGVGLEGLSAPRVRFLAPPEITLVTIRPG